MLWNMVNWLAHQDISVASIIKIYKKVPEGTRNFGFSIEAVFQIAHLYECRLLKSRSPTEKDTFAV